MKTFALLPCLVLLAGVGAACTTPAAPAVVIAPEAPKPISIEPGIYRVSDGQVLSPKELMGVLSQKRYIFVGESHDNVHHHKIQRQIIEGLARRNTGAVAVGMEMFQVPYQEPLDAYMRQEVDEATMLLQTQYADRWGYDFSFYRPILELMMLQGSHVVALNAPKELTRKVSKEGIKGLNEQEREMLPPTLDESSPEHREMIKSVFDSFHEGMDEDTFARFYKAQVIWDATMGSSAVEFMQTHKDTVQIVILAGMFHVQYGLGIPHHVGLLDPEAASVIVIPMVTSAKEPVTKEDFLGGDASDYVWIVEGSAE